jgi:hypothetical protein
MILWARIRTAAKAKAEELAGRKPMAWGMWLSAERWGNICDKWAQEASLPYDVFKLLVGYEASYYGPPANQEVDLSKFTGFNVSEWVRYATIEAANAALQRAIWQWAKIHVLNAGKLEVPA